MTNALFTAFKVSLLKADCDLDDSLKWCGVDHTDDTPVPATDDFLDDIIAGGRVGTSAALASKTFTAGTFDAADTVATAVTGDQFESIILYDDTPGTDATRDLIVFWDTATGLPCTPNGGDITLSYNASGIFAI